MYTCEKGTGIWMKLDHVVYFTKQSPAQIVTHKRQEGLPVVEGGRHERWGTWNALLYTSNAYVEWLSVEHALSAAEANHPLIELLLYDLQTMEEGWGTVCLAVKQIEKLQQTFEKKGYVTSGVLHASRRTKSGLVRKWKMLFIEQQVSEQLPYPFFIEWDEPDEKRYEALRQEGAITKQNDEWRMTACYFGVSHPEKVAAEWAQLLDVKQKSALQLSLSNGVQFVFHSVADGKERLMDVGLQHSSY